MADPYTLAQNHTDADADAAVRYTATDRRGFGDSSPDAVRIRWDDGAETTLRDAFAYGDAHPVAWPARVLWADGSTSWAKGWRHPWSDAAGVHAMARIGAGSAGNLILACRDEGAPLHAATWRASAIRAEGYAERHEAEPARRMESGATFAEAAKAERADATARHAAADAIDGDEGDEGAPCVDCGDPNAFDDWECREGVARCCDCNEATFRGKRSPREWHD